MSTEWDTEDEATDENHHAAAGPAPVDPPRPAPPDPTMAQDPGVLTAMDAHARAQDTAAAARAAAQRARDDLADAVDALKVHQAKADEFDDDPKKAPWQRLAARAAVDKADRVVERCRATLTTRRDDVAAAEALLEQTRHDVEVAIAAASVQVAPPAEPQLVYGSVDEFVREYLRHVYARRISSRGSGRIWLAAWWKNDEAVIRLEALWRAWEHLRLDPTLGMSVWWRDHADHHMAVLLDPDGPFSGLIADTDRSDPGQPLPYLPPPDGMFTDARGPKPVPAPDQD